MARSRMPRSRSKAIASPGSASAPTCRKQAAKETVSLGGRWVTPGLIDCHTHLVFGGERAGEFEQRLKGATYEEIAKAGGGIVSTVRATRAASEAELIASAKQRLATLMAEGLTTIEIKSGYGLDVANERKTLRVARALGREGGVTVKATCLAAHALPPEFAGKPDDYIDLVCNEILPAVAAEGLADAVDAFSERIAFTAEQTARVFDKAKSLGLPVKLHADQLSDMGGAALAARYNALSADHIEYSAEAGIAAMGKAGTVAVLLPGAFFFLREKQLPPMEPLRRHNVRIAISTDCNPGSSPALSLLLDDEHGLHPVPHDAGRDAGRRHQACRRRARHGRHARPAARRLRRRPRDLGHRPAGGAQLLARRQSMRRRRAGRPLAQQELLTMTGRILRSSDYQRMPWKNGGGTTTEIWKAASPAGEMLWRLSIADVASDGPFSEFPGIDRWIMVIAGKGMELTIDGHGCQAPRSSVRALVLSRRCRRPTAG